MRKVAILSNSINGLFNFRRELIEKLIKQDFKVIIVAPKGEKTIYFEKKGCKCINIVINRRGTNPVSDFFLFKKYVNILKRVNPSIVLTYTIKPNVYGGIACRFLKIPYIANITGLGTSIESRGLISKISLLLYKIGLKKANCVFFQNIQNKNFFSKNKLFSGNARLVPGSGVNLEKFTYGKYPINDKPIRLLYIGRIMKAKGILELLEAAKRIKTKYSYVEFNLLGKYEEDLEKYINEFESKGIIRYHGVTDNVHSYIKNNHAIINPSHHEGMSNVLLEAASTGRPVLASRVPGCMETFDEGISGYGFEARNVDSLVKTIIKFINLPYEQKIRMGINGRRKIEKEFDRKIVIDAYLEEINKTVNKEK